MVDQNLRRKYYVSKEFSEKLAGYIYDITGVGPDGKHDKYHDDFYTIVDTDGRVQVVFVDVLDFNDNKLKIKDPEFRDLMDVAGNTIVFDAKDHKVLAESWKGLTVPEIQKHISTLLEEKLVLFRIADEETEKPSMEVAMRSISEADMYLARMLQSPNTAKTYLSYFGFTNSSPFNRIQQAYLMEKWGRYEFILSDSERKKFGYYSDAIKTRKIGYIAKRIPLGNSESVNEDRPKTGDGHEVQDNVNKLLIIASRQYFLKPEAKRELYLKNKEMPSKVEVNQQIKAFKMQHFSVLNNSKLIENFSTFINLMNDKGYFKTLENRMVAYFASFVLSGYLEKEINLEKMFKQLNVFANYKADHDEWSHGGENITFQSKRTVVNALRLEAEFLKTNQRNFARLGDYFIDSSDLKNLFNGLNKNEIKDIQLIADAPKNGNQKRDALLVNHNGAINDVYFDSLNADTKSYMINHGQYVPELMDKFKVKLTTARRGALDELSIEIKLVDSKFKQRDSYLIIKKSDLANRTELVNQVDLSKIKLSAGAANKLRNEITDLVAYGVKK